MTDVAKLLRELSRVDQTDAARAVNVRARVLQTITTQLRPAPLDVLPIAFTGVAIAVAAVVVIALLPAWQTMSEPWVCYLP
jgi:ABC-type phosphate/phosphonate transport system permease subunit